MTVAEIVGLACDFVSGSSSIFVGAFCALFLSRLVVSLLRNGGVA